ncbi:cytochrome c maturation protein CcmE [Chloroflexota bacterium]
MCLALGYLGYLGYTLLESSLDYYSTVSELKGLGDSVYNQGLRVNGEVVSDSIESDTENNTLTFTITDGKESMDVIYKGSRPDNFGNQTQVVLEGKLDSTQIFRASLILTKCPSKYEAEE